MFKLAILASLLVAVSAIPAADLAARARTTETITDYGCVQYVEVPGTETQTVPATTTTVHDPRTTSVTTIQSVYPPGMKRQGGWDTIVESVVCAKTQPYLAATTVYADPTITATRTAFASTETFTETYTLCVGENVCA
ncbi:hypothetical protein BD626DRAFT_574638 [Schizophyllum amplum]|uniref:Uncharacterized protein n=1 Tax=Schizophyllum amplum TaxID=97359 RepID=A0A550BXP0_9AGAR|nr:hypothetical protein BD626DRAFT_574638 [Auriculariopsis ampla]